MSARPKVSTCCGAPVQVGASDEGTNYYLCIRCKEPCDLKEEMTAEGKPFARVHGSEERGDISDVIIGDGKVFLGPYFNLDANSIAMAINRVHAAAVKEAVEKEREEVGEMAERWADLSSHSVVAGFYRELAAAIRARGKA